MKSQDDSSIVHARLYIFPWRFKRISAKSSVLIFLIYLSSSWQVPNVPSWYHFSKVDNPGRSVPTATSRVDCPTIKAVYRWSKVLSTRASPDELKFDTLAFFPLSRKEDS